MARPRPFPGARRRLALILPAVLVIGLLTSGSGPAQAADWRDGSLIVGKWWLVGPDGNPDPSHQVTIARSDNLGDKAGPSEVRFGLDDQSYSDWVGRYTDTSQHVSVRFERKPKWDEMGSQAPEVARRAVEGKLTWQLNLTFGMRDKEGSSLSGTFDQRDIKIVGSKDFKKGTFEQQFSWQPAAKPRKVDYVKARIPVVFVPGIAGSELVDFSTAIAGGKTVWIGPYDKSVLTLDPTKPRDRIVADDVLRSNWLEGYGDLLKALVNAGYREYNFTIPSDRSDMSRLTTASCDVEGQKDSHPTLFVLPYDWRYSVRDAAARLKDYIGCVQRFYPGTMVDLVAHSMGGLVSRRYILDNPGSSSVHQLITIATPWLGAPKAIYTMLTGDFGIPQLVAFHSTMKELAAFFVSAHELLPSRSYFAIAPSPVSTVTQVHAKQTDHLLSYEEFVTWLDGLVPATSPATAGGSLHDSEGMDDWRSDSSGISYFHIYGVQATDETIVRVENRQVTRCTGAAGERRQSCRTITQLVAIYGKGDGTVPAQSASRQGSGDLNFSGARVQRVTCLEQDLCSHTGLIRNQQVQLLVINALGVA